MDNYTQNQVLGRRPKKKRNGCVITLLIFLILLILVGVVFLGQVLYYVKQIKNSGFSKEQTAGSQADVSAIVLNNELVTDDDPSFGPVDAKVQIVEFADFQCPYCLQAFPVVKKILAEFGNKIHFVYRDFPLLDMHPEAVKAAEAGECAQEQGKFWQLHDKIFQNQDRLSVSNLKLWAGQAGIDTKKFNSCLDSGKYYDEVLDDLEAGIKAGVEGTPTFFINGYKVPGVISEENFRKVIMEILRQDK